MTVSVYFLIKAQHTVLVQHTAMLDTLNYSQKIGQERLLGFIEKSIKKLEKHKNSPSGNNRCCGQ